jgi:hypothetical protein
MVARGLGVAIDQPRSGAANDRDAADPHYTKEKRLKNARIACYWFPHPRDIKAGFLIRCEALGVEYGAAIALAAFLNQNLDEWLLDTGAVPSEIYRTGFGTVAWLFDRYLKSPAFEKRVSKR